MPAIIHFDVDPRAHGRTIRTDIAVLGDLGDTLPPFVRGAREGYQVLSAWWRRIRPVAAGGWGARRADGRAHGRRGPCRAARCRV